MFDARGEFMKDSIPLITVIIPVYNVEKYLRACLESVIRQTYKKLEIVLVNDGSTDGSKMICEEYKEKDNRITLINQKNGGLSAARNSGLKIAHGQYFFLLDSDDVIHVKTLQLLYECMEESKCDIAITSSTKILQNVEPDIYEHMVSMNPVILSGKECNMSFFSTDIDATDMTVAWGKLYPRYMFDKIKYPEGKLHEDEYVTYKILDDCSKCAYLKIGAYYYRTRNESIMSEKKEKNYIDAIGAFKEREFFFERQNKADEQALSIYRILTEYTLYYEFLCKSNAEKQKRAEVKKEFTRYYKKKMWRKIANSRIKIKFAVFNFSPLIHHIFV